MGDPCQFQWDVLGRAVHNAGGKADAPALSKVKHNMPAATLDMGFTAVAVAMAEFIPVRHFSFSESVSSNPAYFLISATKLWTLEQCIRISACIQHLC
uniref:Uncharacterized protein n=1 Tax=Gasterosteus aculeatus TaxID=69293 RepID=G3PAE0_GASAC